MRLFRRWAAAFWRFFDSLVATPSCEFRPDVEGFKHDIAVMHRDARRRASARRSRLRTARGPRTSLSGILGRSA